MNKLAQSAGGENLCGYCGRRWSGPVAYCPYCGRKPSSATEKTDDRPRTDEALASGPGVSMPAAESPGQAGKSPPREPRGTPLQGMPMSGQSLPGDRDRPAPSQSNKAALTLLFIAVALGVGALLLFWMGLKLLAPETNEGASPRLPRSTSGVVSPSPGSATGAAPAPSVPPRTDTAAPPRTDTAAPPRTGTAAPPPSNKRSLCSPANEAAGLCKSRE